MLLSGSYIGWCGASDPVSTVPFGAYEPDTVHSHMVSEAKHVAYAPGGRSGSVRGTENDCSRLAQLPDLRHPCLTGSFLLAGFVSVARNLHPQALVLACSNTAFCP